MSPGVDVRLYHNAHNGIIARFELLTDVVEHFGLVVVVLRGVTVYMRA